MTPYEFMEKRQGPAPLPESKIIKADILENTSCGTAYAMWREIYFAIYYKAT